MSPAAHFDHCVIHGAPNALLGDGRAVIAIRVPKSFNTPHVHSSGRIYQRVNDGSEPIKDQATLRTLFERRSELDKRYTELLGHRLDIPEHRQGAPMLRLTFVSDLWRERGAQLVDDDAEVTAAFRTTDGKIASMPFDLIHPTATGHVARQYGAGQDIFGATWEVRHDLVSDVLLPLHVSPDQGWVGLRTFLQGYDHAARYVQALEAEARRDNAPRVLDATALFGILAAVVRIQQRLMAASGVAGSFWFRAELLNLRNTTPFVDAALIVDHVIKHGAPRCPRDTVEVLPGTGTTAFLEVGRPGSDLDTVFGEGTEVPIAIGLLTMLFPALGLPNWIVSDDDGPAALLIEVSDAGRRANAVLENRREGTRMRR